MPLHQVHHVLHQEVALHLHDGRGRGADKQHEEIVAGFTALRFVFFVEFRIVKSHFKRRAREGEVVQAHAHVVQGLAEVVFAFDGPANLQQMVVFVETDARLFFVKTVGTFTQ